MTSLQWRSVALYRVTLRRDRPVGPDGTASEAVAGTAFTPPVEVTDAAGERAAARGVGALG